MAIILLNCFEQCEYIYSVCVYSLVSGSVYNKIEKQSGSAAQTVKDGNFFSSMFSAPLHGIYSLNQYFAFSCMFAHLLSQSLSFCQPNNRNKKYGTENNAKMSNKTTTIKSWAFCNNYIFFLFINFFFVWLCFIVNSDACMHLTKFHMF